MELYVVHHKESTPRLFIGYEPAKQYFDSEEGVKELSVCSFKHIEHDKEFFIDCLKSAIRKLEE